MFGDEDVSLVCLRNKNGWNVVGKGYRKNMQLKRNKGVFMLMPISEAWVYAKCKWKSLEAFQGMPQFALCF